jgi:hypothetical protein
MEVTLMHKGTIENKALKEKHDIYIGADGKQVHRSDLEDPERSGYIRRGILLSPTEYIAAHTFGLKNLRGDTMALVETSPDPFRVKPGEAPAELREVMELARKELEEAMKLVGKAGAEYAKAEEKIRRAMGDGSPQQYSRLKAEEEKARKLWLVLRDEEQQAVVKFHSAERKVSMWCESESIRRREEAQPRRKIEEEREHDRKAFLEREKKRLRSEFF